MEKEKPNHVAIWKHNALQGGLTYALASLNAVKKNEMTTEKQKNMASSARLIIRALLDDIKVERNPAYSTEPRAVKRRLEAKAKKHVQSIKALSKLFTNRNS
jgi:hypothetical protein